MFNDVLNDINKEEQKLMAELSNPNEMATFFEDFLLNNSLQSFDGLLTIDLVDLMIAHISSKCDEFPFNYIKNVIENNREIIEANGDKLPMLASYIEALCDTFSYDEIINSLNNNTDKTEKIRNFDDADIEGLINLFETDRELMREDISVIYCIKEIRDSYSCYGIALEQFASETNSKVKDKDSRILLKKMACEEYKVEEVQDILQSIKDYGHDLIKNEQSKQRRLKKEITNYRVVNTWLNNNSSKHEITNIPKELLKISNENIQVEILRNIYLKNKEYYTSLENKYRELSTNSYNQFVLLFKKYGININDYDINFDDDISITTSKLEHIKNMNINDCNTIVSLLNTASLESISFINNLMTDGYLSSEFICANLNIFNNEYNNLIENIEYLKNENISKSKIKNMEDILTLNKEKLNKSISTIKEYDLFKAIKNCNNYSFLKNDDLAIKIDKILELGYENILIDDPDLLNKDLAEFDKCLLINSLNINISNSFELNTFLNTDLGINSEAINNYIFDITPFIEYPDKGNLTKEEFINLLDTNSINQSNRVYNFDGVLISKNKVRHNLNKIEKDKINFKEQINCLISNKKIDSENYNKMYNCLYSLDKQLIR